MKGNAYLFIAAVVLFAALFSVSSSYAAKADAARPIHLKSGIIAPETARISPHAFSASYSGYYILQLDYIPGEEDKNYLAGKGVHLLSYIPENAWFVYADNADTSSIKGLAYFSKVAAEQKISPYLKESSGTLKVNIALFSDDLQTKSIIAVRGKVISHYGNTVTAEIDASDLNFFAGLEKVKWIESANFRPVILNDGTRGLSSSEVMNATLYSLLGTNVTVSIWDSGNANHSDYNSRRTIGDPGEGDFTQHTTHVAGTVLGDGNRSSSAGGAAKQWRGVAPNATLVTYEWWNTVSELLAEHNSSINTYNASVSQNSWGLGPNHIDAVNCTSLLGSYNSDSQYLDNITRGSLGRRITQVWAAGNERSTLDESCGSLGFTYNTTAPYATSKNIITVGAVNKTGSISSFTSWGPTDDGRIKPDVVAVGVSVKSTNSSDTYESLSGTSMATPVVSGIVALIYQDFHQIFNRDPLPSTVKALLIHTAADINNTGPDYHTGYGLVNATKAIEKLREDNYTNVIIEDNVTQGTNNTFTIAVPNGQTELKITLVWDDYPADPAAAATLVNDLDLLVYNASGWRLYPWTLNNTNPAGSAVQSEKDSTNNVEQVYISAPASGAWTVTVNGITVPNGPQNYSLIITNSAAPQISFVSPTPANSTNISAAWAYVSIRTSEQLSNATLEWNNGTMTNYTMANAVTGFYFNMTSLANGTYSYRVFANDTVNNTNVSDVRYVTVDTIVPSLAVLSPLNQTYNTTPSLNFTLTNSFGAIDRCWYVNADSSTMQMASCLNISSSSFNVSEGFNNITVYVNDTAGNTNYSVVNFTIITAVPSLALDSPENRTYNSTLLALNYTASAGTCWFFNATGGRVNLSGCVNATFNATPDSQNNITLYINDTANNTNSIQRFFAVDVSVPNITVLSPMNQTYNATPSLNFTITNSFGAIDRCWYVNSSGSSIQIDNCLNVSSLSIAEGFSNITVYINDTGGNANVSYVNFTIDLIPSLTVSSPQNRTYNTTIIQINYTASDSVGLDRCWIINVTGGLQTITGCANITINATPNQNNNITIIANDTGGNSNSSTVFFTVDTILPGITFSSPSPNNEILNNAKTIIINVTVSEPSTALLEFSSQNSSMNNSFGSVWTKNVTISSAGNYTFRVWANDTANNTNVSAERWVYINDTVKPSLNVSSPTNGTYTGSTIQINYMSGDNIAVDKCWYRLNSDSNVTISVCSNTTVTAVSGLNTIAIAINDTGNNRNETRINFTYIAPTATPTPTPGSGGAGPGGSSSVNATPTPTRTPTPAALANATATPTPAPASTVLSIANVTANRTTEIDVPSPANTNLKKIEIVPKSTLSNVKIETTKILQKPAEVTQPSGTVYHFIKIDKVNMTDADVSSAKIGFQVEKSWIDSNNIDENKVTLNRFSGGTWAALATTKTGEDATYVFYSADSPGLSVFAITAEEKPAPTPATSAPTPAPAASGGGTDFFLILFVILALVAVGGAAYYFYHLQKIPKEIIIITEKRLAAGESIDEIKGYLVRMGYTRNTVERIMKKAVQKI